MLETAEPVIKSAIGAKIAAACDGSDYFFNGNIYNIFLYDEHGNPTAAWELDGSLFDKVGHADGVMNGDVSFVGIASLDACAWLIGGDFLANGQDLGAAASWALTVAGDAQARGAGNVSHSDASGGSTIMADQRWTHDDTNLNWDFTTDYSASGSPKSSTSRLGLGLGL